MRVIVIGASAAGCFATVLLARAGHEVLVSKPGEVYTDPEVAARTHATLRDHVSDPSIVQPARDRWLAALNTGGRSAK